MVTPIDTLLDLHGWVAPEQKLSKRGLRNYNSDKYASNEREILVCHDLKGGYLDEESIGGSAVSDGHNPYTLLNWWNIDVFCYFSHHFVTIPPLGYINVAHDHGCLVMGTFITEWKEGKSICEQFLASEELVEATVSKLVEIASFYGFEGWLINIENDLQPEHVPNMCLFLSRLTSEMRKQFVHSRVIWYDSVTADGKLDWQNQLNNKNKCFYDECDGIYLNYAWTDQMLLNSADFGMLNRIYMGVDVFARGCVGHWDCFKSLTRAKLIGLSVALFAPSWIAEAYPNKDQIEYGIRFWRKLTGLVSSRSITSLPFYSNFHPGLNKQKEWFCLEDISIQAAYSDEKSMIPLPGGGLLLKKEGIHRLFNFDLIVARCMIEIGCGCPISVQINGVLRDDLEANDDLQSYSCELSNIHLRSLEVLVLEESTVISYVKIFQK